MSFTIASGTKSIRQEAAEMQARLNDRANVKPTIARIDTPSDTDLKRALNKIKYYGKDEDKQALDKFVKFRGGDAIITAAGSDALDALKKDIIRMADSTYAPNNPILSYGQDPNHSGKPDPNLAPAGWKDPNGRRN